MPMTRRAALFAGLARTSALLAAPFVVRPAAAAEDSIVVGQVGPFTGLPVPDAPQLNLGMKAAFARVNAAGGVGGRRIALFELDDTYTGDGFVKAFGEAMKRKPVALLSPVGSVGLTRMLDDKLLDRADVFVLNAIPGAESLRNPGHAKLFHVRAGDRQQIEKIVGLSSTLGVSRLALLHQNIPMGSSGLAMTRDAAARSGIANLVAFEATTEAASVADAAAKVKSADAQAVLVIGAPRFMADGVAALRAAGFGQFVFALSYAPATLVRQVAGSGSRGVGLAQTFPNPLGVGTPLQREFRAAMTAIEPTLRNYTSFHLEGYITARVFAEAARRASAVSADGVAQALRRMGEIDFGGFRVDFATSNVGSRFVDIGVIDADGRLVY